MCRSQVQLSIVWMINYTITSRSLDPSTPGHTRWQHHFPSVVRPSLQLAALHCGRTWTFLVPRLTCSWRVTTYMGKTYAIGQSTRPTQPFILSWSINWVVSSWSRCALSCSGDAIWWMLKKCMQYGSFHSWINVWVAGKTVWTPCHSARLSRRWSLFVEYKHWTDCTHFFTHIRYLLNFVEEVYINWHFD